MPPIPRIPTRIAKQLGIPAYPLADLRKLHLLVNQRIKTMDRKRETDSEWVMYRQLCELQKGIFQAIWRFLPLSERMETTVQ